LAKKIKRKIRRRPKGSGPRNMYFNMDTQASIVEYQTSDDEDKKKEIYIKGILPAFDKLVENLIFVYGFTTPYDTFDIMKSDCVSFLYESLHKWSPEKGTKAFSYYNVVAKNWLIINSRQQRKRMKRHVSVDHPDLMSNRHKEIYECHDIMPAPDQILINANIRNEIRKILEDIRGKITSETEISCIDAVKTVFENIDDLDFLNKRAILIYVREISGLSPKQLSVAMSSIRKHYRKLVGPDLKYDIF
jgi:hypothetical protein